MMWPLVSFTSLLSRWPKEVGSRAFSCLWDWSHFDAFLWGSRTQESMWALHMSSNHKLWVSDNVTWTLASKDVKKVDLMVSAHWKGRIRISSDCHSIWWPLTQWMSHLSSLQLTTTQLGENAEGCSDGWRSKQWTMYTTADLGFCNPQWKGKTSVICVWFSY